MGATPFVLAFTTPGASQTKTTSPNLRKLHILLVFKAFKELKLEAILSTGHTVYLLFEGPRELTGAVDLITHYKLLPHHEFFCKKSLPVSIADTHYLHNVVGDTEIRKGEGMQLDQLIQNPSYSLDGNTRIRPFDLNALSEAFHLRETTPVELPSDAGGEHSKKHHDKKRKHDGDEDVNDIHRHKKSKHKSSKIDEMGAIKVAGILNELRIVWKANSLWHDWRYRLLVVNFHVSFRECLECLADFESKEGGHYLLRCCLDA
uniref:Uncharacterized protein n=1 Tax=Chenopodium quinoa TaxID=63459 RepID=A0A803L866_CHEQI